MSIDRFNWTFPTKVETTYLKNSVAMTEYDCSTYNLKYLVMFFQGTNGAMYFNSTFVYGPQKVGGVGTSYYPSATQFYKDDSIYVFHHGKDPAAYALWDSIFVTCIGTDNCVYWLKTQDGKNWTYPIKISNETTDCGPTLCNNSNTLVCFIKGQGGILKMSTFDRSLNSWSEFTTPTYYWAYKGGYVPINLDTAPTSVYLPNGKVMVLWQDPSDDNYITYSTFDGKSWALPVVVGTGTYEKTPYPVDSVFPKLSNIL
ncbi:hypothetical protein PPL_03945 [Heterostelium album PN500]|uniref:Uncharacterized protein n=1 Tax=Heterostelium pallidum (strain ATCC 26659 / Pp 5 / PN500) TaxID=670386 RepID=D3B5K7_HETP5|nr:hypothetical protein PPL_03945 [Heterostelium album PN500]EFA83155.1 hypothetical protein PPL_03945 [Heterostelium album PN500]|eukprot:XP_020435272.1 hypothetical protein PPL_03945 [Heterostelium album PN500]